MDAKKGKYCECIEKKLPKEKGRDRHAFLTVHIDNYADIRNPYKELTDKQIEARFIRFGLDPHEVGLLMLRFVEGKAMKEIIEIQGWVSRSSADYHLKTALHKLRARKFRFR